MYQIGDLFLHETFGYSTLGCYTKDDYDNNVVTMCFLSDGMPWRRGIIVNNMDNITENEFNEICAGSNRKFIKVENKN